MHTVNIRRSLSHSSTSGTFPTGMPKILPKRWRKKYMAYYHDLVTKQSWQELILLKKLIPFVLIGGWATYLYTKSLKSKDIDIIIDYPALSALKKFYDVHKNERLAKYEAVKGPVQIDIYLPHYSRLGIPAEEI